MRVFAAQTATDLAAARERGRMERTHATHLTTTTRWTQWCVFARCSGTFAEFEDVDGRHEAGHDESGRDGPLSHPAHAISPHPGAPNSGLPEFGTI